MPAKSATRYQREELAAKLAQIVEARSTDPDLRLIGLMIHTLLAAPVGLRNAAMPDVLRVLHENSGDCCFKQRGYNWKYINGEWDVSRCETCNLFETDMTAWKASLVDREFRELKPTAADMEFVNGRPISKQSYCENCCEAAHGNTACNPRKCGACSGRGYLWASIEDGGPELEIQRCDQCQAFASDLDAAKVAGSDAEFMAEKPR